MGGAGTGTQSVAGSGTVQTIYDLLQYRPDILVNSDDLIHIVNAAIRAISKRLYVLGSDIITGQLSVAIDADVENAYGNLPADFWGMKDKPYVNGKTYPLSPLPSQDVALQYTGTGEPIYYKVMGLRIYVIPEASADCTIVGDYYQRPTAVTVSTSTIPFNELFDDLIADYVEIYFRGPLSKTGNTVQILDKLIKDGVDLIANQYDRKAPVQFPQAVNWGF